MNESSTTHMSCHFLLTLQLSRLKEWVAGNNTTPDNSIHAATRMPLWHSSDRASLLGHCTHGRERVSIQLSAS